LGFAYAFDEMEDMSTTDRQTFPEVSEQLAVFERGIVDLIDRTELETLLKRSGTEGRPLRVKFGMDPSSADLHLGHAVQLLKLRDLQELGHKIVLIVGDATAMVGDPTGRNELRPQLTREAVEANLTTYTDQAGKILDMDRTEVRRNSTWFDALSFQDVLKLAGRVTVAQMLEREDFTKRMKENKPIHLHELMYPVMQGWDSVEIRCDMELGGTDQLFNLLRGRELQQKEGQRGQVVFTMPLINGTDGRKMSKSYGNAIGLTDAPNDMFGKAMSIEDAVMGDWFRLLTRVPMLEVETLLAGHPREAKARLAQEITAFFHSPDDARAAREAFDSQFRDKKLPDDIPEHSFPESGREAGLPLANLLREVGLCKSTSEARRNIEQGGVRLDGEVHKDPRELIQPPAAELLVQVGKRRFARVRAE
jgi:tyrosyl-tRNA synthetase